MCVLCFNMETSVWVIVARDFENTAIPIIWPQAFKLRCNPCLLPKTIYMTLVIHPLTCKQTLTFYLENIEACIVFVITLTLGNLHVLNCINK